MAKNDKNDTHARLLKKFHTLCRLTGKNAYEKQAMVEGYGVESSADLGTQYLIELCSALQKELDGGKASEMDALRKRCIRCLCAYIDARGIVAGDKVGYAKQIACRSTKRDNFNRITAAELRGLIGGFNKERKAFESASRAAERESILVSACFAGYVKRGEA